MTPLFPPLALALIATTALAAPAADLVTSIPGFAAFPFTAYSGYLKVPGPIPSSTGGHHRGGGEGAACSSVPYDELSIHYQLNMAQQTASNTPPVVAWHQGGPGGSSTQGGMIEMSYFQVTAASQRVRVCLALTPH